jgi:hypothetical protein
VEPAARPSAVSAALGHLEAFEFNASSSPSFLSRLPGAQVQLRACVPPRGSCTLAVIKAPLSEPLFPKSSSSTSFTAAAMQAPNPSFERTHNGRPLQALISFWALRVLPSRAAQLKRWAS